MCDVRQAIDDIGKLMPELANEEEYSEYYRTFVYIRDLVENPQDNINYNALGDATVEIMRATLDRHRIIDGRKVIDRSKQRIAALQSDDSISEDKLSCIAKSHSHICSSTESKIERFTKSEQAHRKKAQVFIRRAKQAA